MTSSRGRPRVSVTDRGGSRLSDNFPTSAGTVRCTALRTRLYSRATGARQTIEQGRSPVHTRENLLKRVVLFTFGLLVLASVAFATSGGAASGNQFPSKTDSQACSGGDGDNSIVFNGPDKLWPPNHKYRYITITADGGKDPLGNPSSEMVSLSTTVTSDEGELEHGSGHTLLDANPPAAMNMGTGKTSVTHGLRGERSGRGDGRTYTIDAKATFDNGLSSCEKTFTVTVPHDMGNN
jgi:hypothetical protein